MPVQCLVKICCNFISTSTASSCADSNGVGGLTKSQQYAFVEHLLHYSLPSELMSSVLSKLPVDVVLQFEEKFPSQTNIFQEAWKLVCLKCASKSYPFRCKLLKAVPVLAQETAVTQTLLEPYSPFASEFNFPLGNNSYTCREIFVNAYLSGLLHSYSVEQSNGQNDDSHAISVKRRKRACQLILQEALGSSKHAIPDESMIHMLLNRVTKLTVKSNVVQSLNMLLHTGKPQAVKSLTELVIHEPFRIDEALFDLVKTILNTSPIQTVTVKLESIDTLSNNTWIKKLVHIFSSDSIVMEELDPSLWDATRQLESRKEAPDEVDIYRFDETQENSCQIRNFKLISMNLELPPDYFKDCLNYWYCLESLDVDLLYKIELATNLCNGLAALLSSGRARLKNIRIKGGLFRMAPLCMLGVALNNTELDKSMAFEFCHFLVLAKTPKLAGYDNIVHGCKPKFSSVDKVSLVLGFCVHDLDHCCIAADYVDNMEYSEALVVAVLLQIYNPRKLYVRSRELESDHYRVFHPFVRLCPDEVRLISLILDQPEHESTDCAILQLLSDRSVYNGSYITVHVISPQFDLCDYDKIFKKLTHTRSSKSWESNVEGSLEDFRAMM